VVSSNGLLQVSTTIVVVVLVLAYLLVGYVFIRPKSKLERPALIFAIAVIIGYPLIIFGVPDLSERERAILGVGVLFLLLWLAVGAYFFLAMGEAIAYIYRKLVGK
jgi:hypothetical protein